MLNLHNSIENWIKLKRISSTPPTIDILDHLNLPPILQKYLPKKSSNWQILPLPFLLLLAIEANIYEICTTFYENLDRIAVQEKYQFKLQQFADFAI